MEQLALYREQVDQLFDRMEFYIENMQRIHEELTLKRQRYDQGDFVDYLRINELEHLSRITLKRTRETHASIVIISDKIDCSDRDYTSIAKMLQYRGDKLSDTLPASIQVDTPLVFNMVFRNVGTEPWIGVNGNIYAQIFVENVSGIYSETFMVLSPTNDDIYTGQSANFSFNMGALSEVGYYRIQANMYMSVPEYNFQPVYQLGIYVVN